MNSRQATISRRAFLTPRYDKKSSFHHITKLIFQAHSCGRTSCLCKSPRFGVAKDFAAPTENRLLQAARLLGKQWDKPGGDDIPVGADLRILVSPDQITDALQGGGNEITRHLFRMGIGIVEVAADENAVGSNR